MTQPVTYVTIPSAPRTDNRIQQRLVAIFDDATGGNYMDRIVEEGITQDDPAGPRNVYAFDVEFSQGNIDRLNSVGAEVQNVAPGGYNMTKKFSC